jgi:PAS domain S-box-containing protein
MAEPAEARDEKEHHRQMVADVEALYRPLLELSSDPMYIYLDDEHKAGNERMAGLFGHSKEDWDMTSPFLDNFVAEESQAEVMEAFARMMETGESYKVRFTAIRKDGSRFEAETASIPFELHDELWVLGIIRPL